MSKTVQNNYMQPEYDEAIGSSSVMDGICKDFILAAQNTWADATWTDENLDRYLAHIKHLVNTQEEWIEESKVCERCKGTGEIEIMGDGENFEWDVVGIKTCECIKITN